MKKVKVFQFPIRNSNGGITHYAMNNWKYINKSKFDFDFGTVSHRIDFEDEILSDGAGLKYISCYAEDNEERFIEETRNILKNGYDAVHLHTSFWKSFLVEQIALECKIPTIIVHSHSTHIDIADNIKRAELEKIHNIRKKEFNTSLATDFCACSNAAADWLFGEQIPRDKIKILKNAIDVDKFIFNNDIREKYRRKLGLDGCFVIGHVGRFAYQKNHEFLIDVFSEVSKLNDKARLLLVGGGPLESDIKAKADKLGVADKVIFAGIRNDVNYLLQAMDVFCLPSRFEGLPIVLIEAQATGLKCLTSAAVTDEICITENIKRPQMLEDIWIDMLCELSNGYVRKNMFNEITAAGYNIKEQIKEVERLYLE